MISLSPTGWGRVAPPSPGYQIDWSHPLAEGVVGCWLIHPGINVYDHSRNSDGTLNGSNLLYDFSLCGPLGLRHASTDAASYVGFSANLYDFERTDPFSIEILVLYTDGNVRNVICGNLLDSSGTRGIFLDLNNSVAGQIRVALRNTASTNEIDVKTSSGVMATNGWNHILVTYSGSSSASGVTIYLNGVKQALTTNVNNLSATIKTGVNWCLGRSGNFTGTIGKIGTRYGFHRIWNRELTAADVISIYNEPYSLILPEPPGSGFLGQGSVLLAAASMEGIGDLSSASIGIRSGSASIQGVGLTTADGILAGSSSLILTDTSVSNDSMTENGQGDSIQITGSGDEIGQSSGRA